MIQEHEIPKYKKTKKSNISKSNHKSKHKHQYKKCLIQYPIAFAGKTFINTKLYGYCSICGKIGSVKNGKYKAELEQLEKSRQDNSNFLIAISDEEIYERYHNKLPIFYIEDSFADYVILERENNTKEEYYKKPFIENALKKLDSTLEELKKNMENNQSYRRIIYASK